MKKKLITWTANGVEVVECLLTGRRQISYWFCALASNIFRKKSTWEENDEPVAYNHQLYFFVWKKKGYRSYCKLLGRWIEGIIIYVGEGDSFRPFNHLVDKLAKFLMGKDFYVITSDFMSKESAESLEAAVLYFNPNMILKRKDEWVIGKLWNRQQEPKNFQKAHQLIKSEILNGDYFRIIIKREANNN